MASEQRRREVRFGQRVFDADGNELGRVRERRGGEFVVATGEGVSPAARAESMAGEKALLWRCGECGEVGDIDDVPQLCPSCGASGESIYYWEED